MLGLCKPGYLHIFPVCTKNVPSRLSGCPKLPKNLPCKECCCLCTQKTLGAFHKSLTFPLSLNESRVRLWVLRCYLFTCLYFVSQEKHGTGDLPINWALEGFHDTPQAPYGPVWLPIPPILAGLIASKTVIRRNLKVLFGLHKTSEVFHIFIPLLSLYE